MVKGFREYGYAYKTNGRINRLTDSDLVFLITGKLPQQAFRHGSSSAPTWRSVPYLCYIALSTYTWATFIRLLGRSFGNGARLILRQSDMPMPAGLFLHNIEIQMPYCEALHIDGMVVYSCIGSTTSEYEQTVGIRFAELRKDIPAAISYITRFCHPHLNEWIQPFRRCSGRRKYHYPDQCLDNGKPCCLTSHDQLEFSHNHLRITLARTAGLLLPHCILNEILLYRHGL